MPLRDRIDASTLVIAGGAALFLAHAAWMVWLFYGNALDDAYISFRYAANLAAGEGLVFNPGEQVEGYSNFLWVLLLAACSSLVDDVTALAIALGALATLATLPLIRRSLLRVLDCQDLTPSAIAIATVASCGYVTSWTTSGMETGLHGLLLLAAWYRFNLEHRRGGPPLSALWIVGLGLLRPEALFVVVAAVALRLALPQWPGRWRWVGIVVGALLLYHAWRFAYFGPYLFPNSVHAKVGANSAQLIRGGRYFLHFFLLPCAPLLLCGLLLQRSTQRLAAWTGVALVYGQLAFVIAVGGDWSQGRFFAPIVPLAALLTAAALAPWLGRRSVQLAVIAWLLCLGIVTGQRETAFRRYFADNDQERIAIGRWLESISPEDAVIAVSAAGEIPYYSKRYAHDMLGLTEPRIGKRATPELGEGYAGHEKYDLEYTLRTVEPDVIIEGNVVPGFDTHPVVRSRYEPVLLWTHNQVLARRDLEWLR